MPAREVDAALAIVAIRNRQIDQSVTIEIRRGDRRRRLAGEWNASIVEAPAPLLRQM